MTLARRQVTRRKFLGASVSAGTAIAVSAGTATSADDPGTRQATGVKIGEVTDTSAIALVRVTANASHNAAGRAIPPGKVITLPKDVNIADLRGACPGAAGQVRLRYGTTPNLAQAVMTAWQDVAARTDFSHAFALTGLKPDTVYHYQAETAGPGGNVVHKPLVGRFQTAPAADQHLDFTFTVATCTAYRDLDHPDGFHIFPAMAQLSPRFYVHTGDNVYYDSDQFLANTVALARHHWHRMHGQPRQVAFHLQTPGYWEKDDHDCYFDDCWPGAVRKAMQPFTFEEGLAVFREQVPMGPRTYRTFRWGKGVQIWLTEGRDFRSPNNMKDGPDKTIWGKEQKEWIFKSLLASDADYKILISPTPIVGPDRANKNDNHANMGFRHEGDELRRWLQKNLPERFCWINGDRHWQYHSVHPETGLHEFSVGAGSDQHAGGTPGENKKYHRFHRVLGGFLSVTFRRNGQRGNLLVRHHDVMGKMVYEHVFKG